jgi:hypothetical protein
MRLMNAQAPRTGPAAAMRDIDLRVSGCVPEFDTARRLAQVLASCEGGEPMFPA